MYKLFRIISEKITEYGGATLRLYSGDEVLFTLPSGYAENDLSRLLEDIRAEMRKSSLTADLSFSAGISRANSEGRKANIARWFGWLLKRLNDALEMAKKNKGNTQVIGLEGVPGHRHEEGRSVFIADHQDDVVAAIRGLRSLLTLHQDFHIDQIEPEYGTIKYDAFNGTLEKRIKKWSSRYLSMPKL